jgi:hypothetical protein
MPGCLFNSSIADVLKLYAFSVMATLLSSRSERQSQQTCTSSHMISRRSPSWFYSLGILGNCPAERWRDGLLRAECEKAPASLCRRKSNWRDREVALRVVHKARHRDPTLLPECGQKSLRAAKRSAVGANWPAGRLDMSLRSPGRLAAPR